MDDLTRLRAELWRLGAGDEEDDTASLPRPFVLWLTTQWEQGTALAAGSDLIELEGVGPHPPRRYLATFHLRSLMLTPDGGVTECDREVLAIRFPITYLQHVEAQEIVTVLEPVACAHPSCLGPAWCPGHISRGTSLVELLLQCYDMLTFRNVNYAEWDVLNPAAARWAAANQHRFPTDDRPLRRRRRRIEIQPVGQEAPS